jgi:hypothetical protein
MPTRYRRCFALAPRAVSVRGWGGMGSALEDGRSAPLGEKVHRCNKGQGKQNGS